MATEHICNKTEHALLGGVTGKSSHKLSKLSLPPENNWGQHMNYKVLRCFSNALLMAENSQQFFHVFIAQVDKALAQALPPKKLSCDKCHGGGHRREVMLIR